MVHAEPSVLRAQYCSFLLQKSVAERIIHTSRIHMTVGYMEGHDDRADASQYKAAINSCSGIFTSGQVLF